MRSRGDQRGLSLVAPEELRQVVFDVLRGDADPVTVAADRTRELATCDHSVKCSGVDAKAFRGLADREELHR